MLDILVTLIETYEERRWPLGAGAGSTRWMSCVTRSRTRHSQAELADILGSRSRASEVRSARFGLSGPTHDPMAALPFPCQQRRWVRELPRY